MEKSDRGREDPTDRRMIDPSRSRRRSRDGDQRCERKSNSCKGTLPSHARRGLDLPCAGFAQGLLEARELEGLVQHHKALLHGVAGAVAVAGCEQHWKRPIERRMAWPSSRPFIPPGIRMSEKTRLILGSLASSSSASWALATCLTM